jgi:6-phosphogluconate dehydrogenase
MQLGLIGLGKMGGNMRERIRRAGHTVIGYDRDPAPSDVKDLAELVENRDAPRTVWVMVPAGHATQSVIDELKELLADGDTVVDGGNSRWTDDEKHAAELGIKGIGFVDAGVSGGVWGLQNGYALMVGGDKHHVERLQPIFDALKPEGPYGYVHAGKVGAGHFSKMVHNGIEYGLMHAYAEGFELLEKKDIVKDVPGSFKAWSRGTVVRSWLLDLMVKALEDNPHLDDVSDYTNDSGEGRWTVEEAIALGVPMPVISASLFTRFASRQQSSPTLQAVAALRGQFGGHEVMSVAEGEKLRAESAAGPASAKAVTAKAASKEKPPRSSKQAAAKGRKAASAGPSSGAGATSSSRRGGAASAGPTSGTSSTRKRAAKKS